MKHIALIATLLLSIVCSSCSSKTKVIGLHESIHHDDFEYSVQDVQKLEEIEGRHAQGMFFVISFQVENHARRVDHKWNNRIAYLIDESGNEYENDKETQKQLLDIKGVGYKENYVTGSGGVERTTLVFDLPADVKEPFLQVRGATLMGDVLDGNQYKKTKVKLF